MLPAQDTGNSSETIFSDRESTFLVENPNTTSSMISDTLCLFDSMQSTIDLFCVKQELGRWFFTPLSKMVIAGRGIPPVSLLDSTTSTSPLKYFSMAGRPKKWKKVAKSKICRNNLDPIDVWARPHFTNAGRHIFSLKCFDISGLFFHSKIEYKGLFGSAHVWTAG